MPEATSRTDQVPARPRRRFRGLVIALTVVALLLAAGGGFGYYLEHGLKRTHVNGLTSALTSGKEAGTENFLMIGSTSRCALKVQNPAYGLCSQGVTGVNSDVIMILHVDAANHRLALLSIPRDLFVPNARTTGANKIDAGLYQGLSQVVSSIEEDFGIPIQHAVELNFDQFANVVDALGGINMSFPVSVYDAYSGLNVQAATCVHLDGTQALQVVRARHLQYYEAGYSPYAAYWPHEVQSDLARIRRDHEFLRVLGAAVAKKGIGNPITDLNLINSVKADLTFDQSLSVSAMAHLLLEFRHVNVNSVPQLTLPVAIVTDPAGPGGSLVYRGGNYGDVEFPVATADRSAIDRVLGVASGTDTLTGQPLPAPASVSVSVLNGTGVYQQAADTADALGALGFHIVGTGNSTPTGEVAETVVYYGSHSPAAEAAAEAVVGSMSGSVIMAYDPSRVVDGAQVTVVTGSQFAVSPPSAASPSASSAAGGSSTSAPSSTVAPSTTSTTSAASADIASASPATSSLRPWDPRACPAGAVPTAPKPNPVRP